MKTRGPAQPARPEFYLPLMQIPDVAWTWTGRSLVIVTRGDDVAAMTTAIRGAVKELDSTLPVFASGRWKKDCGGSWRRRASTRC